MNLKKFLGGALLVLSANASWALDVGGVAYMNTDFGGDTLATTNEGDIKAGGIIHFAIGASFYNYLNNQLETQVTIGFKGDSVSAQNGTVSFNRNPVELLQFYRTGMFRAGGGLTYHMNPKFKCEVDFQCNYTANFKSQLGYVLQADFILKVPGEKKFFREFTLGGRYTKIDYTPELFTTKFDGSSIGFSIGAGF